MEVDGSDEFPFHVGLMASGSFAVRNFGGVNGRTNLKTSK